MEPVAGLVKLYLNHGRYSRKEHMEKYDPACTGREMYFRNSLV